MDCIVLHTVAVLMFRLLSFTELVVILRLKQEQYLECYFIIWYSNWSRISAELEHNKASCKRKFLAVMPESCHVTAVNPHGVVLQCSILSIFKVAAMYCILYAQKHIRDNQVVTLHF